MSTLKTLVKIEGMFVWKGAVYAITTFTTLFKEPFDCQCHHRHRSQWAQ